MSTGSWSAETSDPDWESLEGRILDELRAGDRTNLGRLMDRYGEELMGYLMTMLRHRETAEDLFQETWIKVIERIHQFRAGSSFAPWLFRVARNCAYDRLRRWRRWRWVRLGPGERGEPVRELPARENLDAQTVAKQTTDALLERLEPAQRELVWLRYIREMSYEEIADECGLPVGTVKSRVSRAMSRLVELRERMEDENRG
jgi:RNA polymerase sigma-70 factor (ECF subfamily)